MSEEKLRYKPLSSFPYPEAKPASWGRESLEEAPVERLPETDTPDPISHPPHYTGHKSGVECITIVEHFDFVIGNIIKYAWRAGLKDGTSKLDDLKKCLWYAHRAVEREEK